MNTPHATCLYDVHASLGAKFVTFAGYALPLHYSLGVIEEHKHTRRCASLFDVSHMGQIRVFSAEQSALLLERLLPTNITTLAPGRQRYTQLLNEEGGIVDDLIIMNTGTALMLVVNASQKEADLTFIARHLPGLHLEPVLDQSLLALQGPKAEEALSSVLGQQVRKLTFMQNTLLSYKGEPVLVSRAGYTGEDGFEISVPNTVTEFLAHSLLAHPLVQPAGLGARDSLRIEAGLCLYGHDITQATTPIEACLGWSIPRRRRTEGGFLGWPTIKAQLEHTPERQRVGLRLEGRLLAREGHPLLSMSGDTIGSVTSGCMSPLIEAPIAMGYSTSFEPGTSVQVRVRRTLVQGVVVALPFVPHRYRLNL